MLIGSDVVSLFPSLSAENTARAVKNQVLKSPIRWQNIDKNWIRMYIHQNRDLVENIDEICHLLPQKRPGRKGVESGMHSFECLQRHLVINGEKSCWSWPAVEIKEDDIRNLLAVSIEVALKFFFKHFTYNFGGQNYLQ